MTTNEKITAAAWNEVVTGRLLSTLRHGWCLQAVRLIIEDALDWRPYELYERHGTHRTTQAPPDRKDMSWYAADMERSLREQGLAVPALEAQPGDLIFNHASAKPYGHVGLLIRPTLVLEVVSPLHRPRSFTRNNVCLTPLAEWTPTLFARIP